MRRAGLAFVGKALERAVKTIARFDGEATPGFLQAVTTRFWRRPRTSMSALSWQSACSR
jgi:hypothetical protein